MVIDIKKVIPRVLTVAGSDSGGGAGIQADLKSFSAYGVYGTSAVTAITAQNTIGVIGIEVLNPSFVVDQMDAILQDIGTDAAKTGMLANAEIVRAVARCFSAHSVAQLVVDPVMIAKSGHALLVPDAVSALKEHLFPITFVLTPNLPEAESLTGLSINTIADMQRAARRLAAMGCRFVVIKGGHRVQETKGFERLTSDASVANAQERLSVIRIHPSKPSGYPWSEEEFSPIPTAQSDSSRCVVDLVYDGREFILLQSPYFTTANTHGTGCTLSAAIAAGLALGLEPLVAIAEAKRFITQAIQHSFSLGEGHGPTNHLLRFSPARTFAVTSKATTSKATTSKATTDLKVESCNAS